MKNTLFKTLYFLIMKILMPLIKFIGLIHIPFSSKEEIMDKFYEIEKLLQPGDIILSVSKGHLSNLINPGKWKHALMFIGNDPYPSIVEAIGEGVVKKTFLKWLSSKDEICILRFKPEYMNKNQAVTAVRWIKQQIGKPYDYSFDSTTDKSYSNFYCSETVFYAVKNGNPDIDFEMRDTFGIKTVSPNDFYSAKNKLDIIFEYK